MTAKQKVLAGIAATMLLGGVVVFFSIRKMAHPVRAVVAVATPQEINKQLPRPIPTPVAVMTSQVTAREIVTYTVNKPTPAPSPQRIVATPSPTPAPARQVVNTVPLPTEVPQPQAPETLRTSVQCDVGANPSWKPFHPYLETVADMARSAWIKIRRREKLPDQNMTATVALTISKFGEVQLRYVDTKSNHAEAIACAQAVKAVSPFKVWTTPMRQVFSESQDISLIFVARMN